MPLNYEKAGNCFHFVSHEVVGLNSIRVVFLSLPLLKQEIQSFAVFSLSALKNSELDRRGFLRAGSCWE
jgi:hypothetical protein